MLVDRSIVKDPVDPREKDLTKQRQQLGYKNPNDSVEEQIKWALLREDFEDPIIRIEDQLVIGEDENQKFYDELPKVFKTNKSDRKVREIVYEEEKFKDVN